MRTYILLALLSGLAFAADDQKADPLKIDYERLSGTWRLVYAVEDGKVVTRGQVRKVELITKGNTFEIRGDTNLGTSPSGTFTIDPTTKPKSVDSVQGKGPHKGEKILGIYEIIDANHKRACWAPPGQPRPTGFASRPGSGELLQVWKRGQSQP
jgi:uncharacterized protein (TIGR03067 family)